MVVDFSGCSRCDRTPLANEHEIVTPEDYITCPDEDAMCCNAFIPLLAYAPDPTKLEVSNYALEYSKSLLISFEYGLNVGTGYLCVQGFRKPYEK